MVTRYVDLSDWTFHTNATDVCCKCLKQPMDGWYIAMSVADSHGILKRRLCKECKDPQDHFRCCLCKTCAREEGVAW